MQIRKEVTKAHRIVVKVGTRVLVDDRGRPNQAKIDALAQQLAQLHHAGHDVALVSSGAVGAGVEALKMTHRPKTLPELQMAAAIGQARLMAKYNEPFSKADCLIGQVLLTQADLANRTRHLNIRNTMSCLFRHGIIPIVNENDVVSVDEIKVGDNDVLAAMVAILAEADLLVLLSTTNGLKESGEVGAARIPFVHSLTDDILGLAKGKGGELSTGGMMTKLQSAHRAVSEGIPTIIADGREDDTLRRIMAGESVGTLLANAQTVSTDGHPHRKQWIAHFHKYAGFVVIDDGACEAVQNKGKSLLPIGVRSVEGTFAAGSAIQVKNQQGQVIACGLSNYSNNEVSKIMGKKTSEVEIILGACAIDEVIHRDNMVVECAD